MTTPEDPVTKREVVHGCLIILATGMWLVLVAFLLLVILLMGRG